MQFGVQNGCLFLENKLAEMPSKFWKWDNNVHYLEVGKDTFIILKVEEVR